MPNTWMQDALYCLLIIESADGDHDDGDRLVSIRDLLALLDQKLDDFTSRLNTGEAITIDAARNYLVSAITNLDPMIKRHRVAEERRTNRRVPTLRKGGG